MWSQWLSYTRRFFSSISAISTTRRRSFALRLCISPLKISIRRERWQTWPGSTKGRSVKVILECSHSLQVQGVCIGRWMTIRGAQLLKRFVQQSARSSRSLISTLKLNYQASLLRGFASTFTLTTQRTSKGQQLLSVTIHSIRMRMSYTQRSQLEQRV